MTSLERDILIKLSGPDSNDMNGAEAKLNAAYASGGAQMAIMTVQDLLNIKIDKYVQINMQGLIDLVDAVGGITVTNEFDFPISISENEPEYQAKVQPGTHKVNGEQALVYARMRYDDPEGDYGRQKRQRLVIQKVIKKILALNSISSYRKILHAVSNNMQTNIEISSQTIPALLGYADALKRIHSYQLKGEDATLADGGSYQIVKEDHLLAIQNRIRRQLGLSEITELKTSAVTYEELYGLEGSSKAKAEASSEENTQSEGQYSGQVNNNSSYYSTPNNFSTGVPSESIPSTVPGSTNSSVTGGTANSGSLPANTGATTEPVNPVSPAPNGGN